MRLTRIVGTEVHKYTWQGGKLIAEQYGDTELEFFYDESGAPYALLVRDTTPVTPTETWYYYVTDLQGDVMQILDASGNVVASYTYNAWGEILNLNNNKNANIGGLNPIRYRGYYFDSETGFYYLKSRYYDPRICRFINADIFTSTGHGFVGCNIFAYCLNNSVNVKDSGGRIPTSSVAFHDCGGVAAIYSSFSELTIKVRQSSIVIDAYIVFEGEIDENILIQGIQDYWEGDYNFPTGQKNVKVNVHTGQTSDGRSIHFSSVNGNGRSNTYSTFRGQDESRVTIYSRYENGASKNIGWSSAHEFGHCLGIGDYYTLMADQPDRYSYIESIMNQVNTHAQLRDVMKAIAASKTGLWQSW